MALAGMLLVGSVCRAEDVGPVWAAWWAVAEERYGPEKADGLLVYFHEGGVEPGEVGVPLLFTEMARIARWDILRINRQPAADLDSADDEILRVTADRIAHARREGYKRIVVAGIARGGWLALMAATLPDVDAAIGLAPGTTTAGEGGALERSRDALTRTLAGARARHVAAFFFEDDPRQGTGDGVDERPAVAMKRALRQSGSGFMVVDRPPDLDGPQSAWSGRFIRRYRDCLLDFVRAVEGPAGEVACSRSSGYAVGAEIGFPDSPFVPKLPVYADPAFAAYWGRWEGDDKVGAYYILEAVAARQNGIVFRMGVSASPLVFPLRVGFSDDSRTSTADLAPSFIFFRHDPAHGRLYHKLPNRHDLVMLRPRSATELVYEVQLSNDTRIWRTPHVLRRRSEDRAG